MLLCVVRADLDSKIRADGERIQNQIQLFVCPGCDDAKSTAGIFQRFQQLGDALKGLHEVAVFRLVFHPEGDGLFCSVRDAEIFHIPYGSPAENMAHLFDLWGEACDGEESLAQGIEDAVGCIEKGSVYIKNDMLILLVHS